MVDVERLAAELAALTPEDRSLVMQRLAKIGPSVRDLRARLRHRRRNRGWAQYLGEDLYDTYGVPLATLCSVKLLGGGNVELTVMSNVEGSETWREKQQQRP